MTGVMVHTANSMTTVMIRQPQSGGLHGVSEATVSRPLACTRSAALEVAAKGIRVNAVAPGPVATEGLHRFTGGDESAMPPWPRRSQLVASVASTKSQTSSSSSPLVGPGSSPSRSSPSTAARLRRK